MVSIHPFMPLAEYIADTSIDKKHSRDGMLEKSRDLEDLFRRDRVRIAFDPSDVEVPEEAIGALHSWIISESSALLSIAAPDSGYSLGPSTGSQVAAKVIYDADAAGIPVICYFCELEQMNDSGKAESPRVRAVMALAYALLRQLLEWLPANIDELQPEVVQALEGLDDSLSSFEAALSLISFAIKHAPPMLYCVIAEFQVLEETRTTRAIEAMVDLMQSQLHDAGKVVKVLITTSGQSRCLLGKLSPRQLVSADERQPHY